MNWILIKHNFRPLMSGQLRAGILSLIICWLCGCAQLVETPTYVRPELPVKQDWSAELASQRQIDIKWWRALGDPRLNEYMDKAIADNANLQVFAARMGAAEAQISQAKATLLPVISAGTRTDTTDISGDFDLGKQTKFGTGGDLVWELDVWGKARKGVAAQQAAYAASEADWRAGYLVLAGAVASTYFQIRRSDEQIQRQAEAIDRGTKVLAINKRMRANGLAAQTLVTQQEAELNRLNTQLLELERGRALAVNGLATLIGEVAGDFVVPNTTDDPVPTPVSVPAGLPSELLSRRPDLVAAEYRLLQAVELEGQARLARLPSIGITGIGGSASFGLSDILKTWTAGLSSIVQFPVFDPNVRARVKVSEAQVGIAEAQYRTAVFQAFEEVENQLVNLANRSQQKTQLVQRAERLRSVNDRYQDLLNRGLISQLELFERERSLLAAEQAVHANHWQLLDDTVALFKTLGGGWDRETVGLADTH